VSHYYHSAMTRGWAGFACQRGLPFSCLLKRNHAKRRAPRFRARQPAAVGFVPTGRAFRQHILCVRKGGDIPVAAPADLIRRPAPLQRERGSEARTRTATPRTRYISKSRPGTLFAALGFEIH